jgi:hypothetical protein
VDGLLDGEPKARVKSFIKSFIREARVRGDEVILTYTLPISGRLTEQIRAVPPIAHYGGRYCTIDRTFELAFVVNI